MPLVWNDSLLTGVTVVDSQHKELFRRINELLDSAGKSRERVQEITNFLQNYIVNHFGTEERLMLKTGYSDYQAHKGAHDKYSQEFKELKESIDREGVNINLTVKMNSLLIDWWINHINKVDKKMAEFIRDKI
ncbi:MAG: bacteriohemerythrin [bacterium]|nr:bacteriohemerythrin [bacterium]